MEEKMEHELETGIISGLYTNQNKFEALEMIELRDYAMLLGYPPTPKPGSASVKTHCPSFT